MGCGHDQGVHSDCMSQSRSCFNSWWLHIALFDGIFYSRVLSMEWRSGWQTIEIARSSKRRADTLMVGRALQGILMVMGTHPIGNGEYHEQSQYLNSC